MSDHFAEPSARALEELGYDPSISKRIVEERPDIYQKILKYNAEGSWLSKPLTVYRGIDVEPEKFEPQTELAKMLPKGCWIKTNSIYASKNLDLAYEYAATVACYYPRQVNPVNFTRSQTLLEYEVPSFMYYDVTPFMSNQQLNIDAPPASPVVGDVGILNGNNMPDNRVFIKRIGIVDVGPLLDFAIANPQGGPYFDKKYGQNIQWFLYDEAFKEGKFVRPPSLKISPWLSPPPQPQ